jgi:hypothetical protein
MPILLASRHIAPSAAPTTWRGQPLVLSVIHAAVLGERRSFLLRMFGDRRLGGDDQTRDRRGGREGRAHDLGRIDNAERDEIAVFAGWYPAAKSGRVLLRHARPRYAAAPWPTIAPPRTRGRTWVTPKI